MAYCLLTYSSLLTSVLATDYVQPVALVSGTVEPRHPRPPVS